MRLRVWILPPLFLLVAACSVRADVPDPGKCTVPGFIDVVGAAGGVPDPLGTCTITVRDVSNNPIPGAVIVLDFKDCTDLRLSTNRGSGTLTNCSDRQWLAGFTDAAGRASFIVVGAGNHTACGPFPALEPGPGFGCVRVFADGMQIGTMTATIFDLNGVAAGTGGLEVSDLGAFRYGYYVIGLGASAYKGRYDYSHDGVVSAEDLSVLANAYWLKGSRDSETEFCP